MRATSLLFPRIGWRNVGFLIACAALGSLIAGAYGIVHDQITYSLSESYFTEFKFHQFASSDPRVHLPPDLASADRIYVGVIGFLATWWVGFFSGWFLARASIPPSGDHPSVGTIAKHFLTIIGTAFLFGCAGFLWGTVRPGFSSRFSSDFLLVGQIHNFGYLGALVGLVVALLLVRRARRATLGISKDTIAKAGDKRHTAE